VLSYGLSEQMVLKELSGILEELARLAPGSHRYCYSNRVVE